MASNGISWAGNIYQKFETMCLEVEEVMYEDTVKYVENQVQKVGVSVKKFYAEVMQDLLPPDGDPAKSPGNLSLNPCDADIDIKKKPKLSMLDGKRHNTKKDAEDDVAFDLTAGKEVNQLAPRNPTVLVENTCSSPCSTKSKIGIQRRTIGIKRISQNNRPSKASSTVTSSSGHGSRKPVHDRTEASSAPVMSSPDKITSTNSVWQEDKESVSALPASGKTSSDESVRATTEDMGRTVPASNDIVLAESPSQMKNDSGCFAHRRLQMNNQDCASPASIIESSKSERQSKYKSGCSSPAADPSSTATARTHSFLSECKSMNRSSPAKAQSSIRNNGACDVKSETDVFVTPNKGVVEGFVMPDAGISVQDDSFHLLSSQSDSCNVEHADDFDMEVIHNDQDVERNIKTFEPADTLELEETCVFVEGDELHLAQEINKHKSYKKKIRDALSSKLRSPRKQDRLVSQSNEPDNGSSSAFHTQVGSDKSKLRTLEPLESDWELL